MNTSSSESTQDHQEYQYLHLIQKVLTSGSKRDDRTGVGTLSLFGAMMRFDLSKGFPLLTTKKMYWKGIVDELLWFLSGCTDSNVLSSKGVRIWNANGSESFLQSRGLCHRRQGDLGPVYGFQWRHWGAEYASADDDYTNKGIDQIVRCIDQIKNTPTSRRIILSAWNVSDLDKMALPPCHILCQFYVSDGKLSCMLTQRSGDIGLGIPFNIASYALLTTIMAHCCSLQPGEFIHCIGDAHIYSNHVSALKQQIERRPKPFPLVTITAKSRDIDSITSSDIVLTNYESHGPIRMKMAT